MRKEHHVLSGKVLPNLLPRRYLVAKYKAARGDTKTAKEKAPL